MLLQNQTTRPTGRRRPSTTMPSSALLCCLVFLAGIGASPAQGTPSENSCTHFSTSLPHMLRELRAAFGRVKTFFVSMIPPHPPSLRLPEQAILLGLPELSFLLTFIPSTHCPTVKFLRDSLSRAMGSMSSAESRQCAKCAGKAAYEVKALCLLIYKILLALGASLAGRHPHRYD